MKINIASNEIIHFIGIGGIGMSGLAQIMHNMGFQIQGSDLSHNKNTERLIKTGIFAYSRNPIYIAFVLFHFSMFLTFENVVYFLSSIGLNLLKIGAI